MSIRPARMSDGAPLRALWQEVDRLHARIRPDFFRHAEGGVRPASALEAALRDPHQALLVAEQQAEIVGFLSIKIFDTPAHPQMVPRRRALIEDLVVDERHRRSGVGRALVEEATRWAREHGASMLVLTVWSGNESAEVFYRRLGFETLNRSMGREI